MFKVKSSVLLLAGVLGGASLAGATGINLVLASASDHASENGQANSDETGRPSPKPSKTKSHKPKSPRPSPTSTAAATPKPSRSPNHGDCVSDAAHARQSASPSPSSTAHGNSQAAKTCPPKSPRPSKSHSPRPSKTHSPRP